MPAHPILREVSLTLPMEPNLEVLASQVATAMAEFMGMSPERVDEVRMAVVEVCINAIEHSRSPDGKIYLTFEVLGGREPETLRITVRDLGVGFAPDDVEEPSIVEKLHATRKRGWGLKIIRGLMDDVSIESDETGTRVMMWKRR